MLSATSDARANWSRIEREAATFAKRRGGAVSLAAFAYEPDGSLALVHMQEGMRWRPENSFDFYDPGFPNDVRQN
jgi:hypothetical protein